MEQFIGCDAHKKFSVFVAVNEKGQAGEAIRVAHDREVYRAFLSRLPPRSAIAVEASGHYSWLVDEMEGLGHRPKLCNPLEAKRRMGLTQDVLYPKGRILPPEAVRRNPAEIEMKVIHVERIGTSYQLRITTGEDGIAETEVCAGRESLIVALGRGGASQKGIFDIFKQLASSTNAELRLS